MNELTTIPPAPPAGSLKHVATASKVHADRTARALSVTAGTVQLAAKGFDADVISEFSALQLSVLARLRTLGEGWTKDWQDWYHYATHPHGANTMSKLAERETNIVSQMTQMMGAQLTDLVNLAENVEVNYAYWLKQKLDSKD